MRSLLACLLVVAAAALVACGGKDDDGTIARSSFEGVWPFTVAEGVVGCTSHPDGSNEITFTANGKTYGLNGFALETKKYPPNDAIWPAADKNGLRPSPHDVITYGLGLC